MLLSGTHLLWGAWGALLLEALDAVGSGLFFTAAVMRLTAVVPQEALPATRGLMGTVYMGIGEGSHGNRLDGNMRIDLIETVCMRIGDGPHGNR